MSRPPKYLPGEEPDYPDEETWKCPYGGYIYFAFCQKLGLMKIGTSNNPARRLAAIKSIMPYPVGCGGWIPGGPKEEKALHKKFAKARVGKTEWFRAVDVDDEIFGLLDQAYKYATGKEPPPRKKEEVAND